LFQDSEDRNVGPTTKEKTRNVLAKEGKLILNKWYEQAQGYPFPNPEDRQKLIVVTGINRSVIVNYFATKRLREGKYRIILGTLFWVAICLNIMYSRSWGFIIF